MPTPAVDPTDARLLTLLQEAFPLVPDPWSALGKELGLSGAAVLERVRALKATGLIRRIGPVLNPAGMRFPGALFACRTRPEAEEATAAFISRFDGVTHNYRRDCEFNLWFTLVAESEARMAEIIVEIRRECRPLDLLRLDAEKTYKIKGTFDLDSGGGGRHDE